MAYAVSFSHEGSTVLGPSLQMKNWGLEKWNDVSKVGKSKRTKTKLKEVYWQGRMHQGGGGSWLWAAREHQNEWIFSLDMEFPTGKEGQLC